MKVYAYSPRDQFKADLMNKVMAGDPEGLKVAVAMSQLMDVVRKVELTLGIVITLSVEDSRSDATK